MLPPVTFGVDDSAVTVDLASAFRDPDGDVLTYRASSSAPHVVTANGCVAVPFEPPASVAVTVTVDVPSDNGVTVTVLPDNATAATDGDEEAAP